MTRSTLSAAAAVLALGAGLSGHHAAADVPTAPPPREKAAAPRTLDIDVAQWADRVAWSERMLRRAEAALEKAAADRQRADALFAQGALAAAQREAIWTAEAAARIDAELARRRAAVDREQFQAVRDQADFAARRDGADVTGTLAVDVVFPDADRGRVAGAARDLVLHALAAADHVPLTAWDAARRGAHVHVRFPTTRRPALALRDGGQVQPAELVVVLPLTREPGGYVLVRDGERVVRVSGFFGDAPIRFQGALSAAVPAGR